MSLRGGPQLLAAIASIGLVAGLAACTPEDPEPTPSASAGSTPTATPSPTPTVPPEAIAPERPAAMNEISVAGAEAAATYFLALYPYTYATGDLAEWRSLSHPECAFCTSVVSGVEQQVAAGGRSEGGVLTVESVSAIDVSADLYAVDIVGRQSAGVEYGPDGSILSESPETRSALSVLLTPGPEGWLVRGVQVDEVPEA